MGNRSIAQMVQGIRAQDGAGVKLTRVLSNKTMKAFDPFLMLDSFDSTDPADYIKGFPWHPHRGMETVTYLIDGQIDHEDSLNNKGSIAAGGSQWMTAGSGILHQEMPQESGYMLGFQLWLNMPKEKKMQPPAYHDLHIENENIWHEEGAIVRVISGNYKKQVFGFQSQFIDATILDISLETGSSIDIDSNSENTVFVFSIVGKIAVNKQVIPEKTAVLFENGDKITIKAASEDTRFIYFEAKPLKEPIAWGGPIVMNTQKELQEAFEELEEGRFIR